LLQDKQLTPETVQTLRGLIVGKANEFETMMQHVVASLSQMTNYVSIATSQAELWTTTLRQIDMIRLDDTRAVFIIVTSTGHVENKVMTLPEQLNAEDMTLFVKLLNEKLVGLPMMHVRSRLYAEVANELERYVTHCEQFLQLFDEALSSEQAPKVFYSGVTHVMNQPEFQNIEKVKTLLQWFENPQNIIQVLEKQHATHNHSGIDVTIGHENANLPMGDCSIVTITYTMQGEPIGRLAILGPTRMEYARVIQTLEQVARDFAIVIKTIET
jgi:heat-inducible transcriptional repressor